MAKKININPDVQHELDLIIHDVRLLSEDLGGKVEKMIRDGFSHPLDSADAARLLTSVVSAIRKGAVKRGDKKLVASLSGDIEEIVERIVQVRKNLKTSTGIRANGNGATAPLKLFAKNGVTVSEVHPTPVFHTRPVRMIQGYLKTRDIKLWGDNDRLQIHLSQFEQLYGRAPTAQELRDIIMSRITLPGIMDLPDVPRDKKEDQFAIKELARSIAVNGVQRPPILDHDFTLIDGNRRVAACQYILDSDDFDISAKERAESIYVWQITKDRTEDDLNNVIIALNFEPHYKEEWPEYVKIRRVYETFRELMVVSPNAGDKAQLEIRRSLARQFALDLAQVTRYIKMMRMVDEFEEYQINDKNRDEYEVKHRANRYIQYFDELTKGTTPGTVLYELDRDRPFKNLVFDLLYNGTFDNYAQVRGLRYIYDNKDGRETLIKARDAASPDDAKVYLDDAMAIARTAQAEKRELGANTTIERFIKFLEELPSKAFRDTISEENLRRLLRALKLVEPLVRELSGKNKK